jgi:hypothetical protein
MLTHTKIVRRDRTGCHSQVDLLNACIRDVLKYENAQTSHVASPKVLVPEMEISNLTGVDFGIGENFAGSFQLSSAAENAEQRANDERRHGHTSGKRS